MKNKFGLNESEYDMLVAADANELRGVGDSVVAVLVRSDDRMRAAATHLLMRMQDVDAAVGSVAAARPRVVVPLRPRSGSGSGSHAGRGLSRVKRATLLSGGLVAAALAAVVVYRDVPAPARPRAATVTKQPLTATINASSDRPFAVIPTDNPDIAIVWLFNKEIK